MKSLLNFALFSSITFSFYSAQGAAPQYLFDSKVRISVLTKDGMTGDQNIERDKPIQLKPETIYWVSSPGRVPLLVIPEGKNASDAPVKIQLPEVAMWPSEVATQQLQAKLAQAIDDLYSFQTALAKRDTGEAEKILNRMEASESMEYYSFLRASLAFVKGDLKTAKDQVQRGLRHYPSNEQGVRLLKTIEGASK